MNDADGLDPGDGQGIGFLAGGTTGHPEADLLPSPGLDDVRKDGVLQGFKDVRLPKEAGHANEQVLVEGHDLGGIRAQQLDVVLQIVLVAHRQAPAEATLESAPLVVGKVDGGRRADQGQEVGKQWILGGRSWDDTLFSHRRQRADVAGYKGELPGDLLDR